MINDFIKRLYFVYEHADDAPRLKYTRFQCFPTEDAAVAYLDKEFTATDACIIVSTPMEKLMNGFISRSFEIEGIPNDPENRIRVKHVTELFIRVFHGEAVSEMEEVMDPALFKEICSCDTVENITGLLDVYNEKINGRA